MLSDLLMLIPIGIGVGCIYGVVGLTLTVIYNATKIINFAQGAFAMIGAFVASLTLVAVGLPIWAALPLFILATIGCSLVLQRLMVNPLMARDAAPIAIIMITIAGSTIIEGIVASVFGYDIMRVPPPWGFGSLEVGVLRIGRQYILIIAVTLLVTLGYWLLLNRTYFGSALRATGLSPQGAALMGISVAKMRTAAFVIAAGIAAVAGYLAAPILAANVFLGSPLLIKGFIACVLGGIGNPYAAVGGGVILGLVAAIAGGYGGGGYGEIAAFVVLMAILLLRPTGLFGAVE